MIDELALARENRRLRDRVDELEEQVRQLREITTPELRMPYHVGLTRGENRFLVCLVFAPGGFASFEYLHQTYSERIIDTKTFHVYISYLRRKLRDAGFDIVIRTHKREGYSIDDAGRRALRALLRSQVEEAA